MIKLHLIVNLYKKLKISQMTLNINILMMKFIQLTEYCQITMSQCILAVQLQNIYLMMKSEFKLMDSLLKQIKRIQTKTLMMINSKTSMRMIGPANRFQTLKTLGFEYGFNKKLGLTFENCMVNQIKTLKKGKNLKFLCKTTGQLINGKAKSPFILQK